MKYSLLVLEIVLATAAVAISMDPSDIPPGRGLGTAGSSNNNTDLLRYHYNGHPKRRCIRAGGFCVRREKDCDGIIHRNQCSGKYKCCVAARYRLYNGPYRSIYNYTRSDTRCPMITIIYVPTITECISPCAKISSCTAGTFNPYTSECCLLACLFSVPINPPLLGFSRTTAIFTGPFNNIFSDQDCGLSIITIAGASLPQCMNYCEDPSNNCTAINFGDSKITTSICSLLSCPFPVPEPTLYVPGSNGYSLSTGFMFGNNEYTTTTETITT